MSHSHSHRPGVAVFMRSVLFMAVLATVTVPYGVVLTLLRPLVGPFTRYKVVQGWSRTAMWLIRHMLGIDYRVLGRENIPSQPSVILC